MASNDPPFSNFPGAPRPEIPEFRKREVEDLLRRIGELFSYVTTLCGVEADSAESDIIYNWIQGNYPDDVERLGKAFSAGMRQAQRKIFRTMENGELAADTATLEWLRAVKSRCTEHVAAKKSLLETMRATTPQPPTWN